MRYVLLDRIETLDPPVATGIKCVSLTDDIFADHFPGYPIYPGALVLESMAQLAGVLLEQCLDRRDLHAVLTMADRVRFRQQVRPGDRLLLSATKISAFEDGGQADVVVSIDDKRVAEARLGFAFVQVTDPRLLQTRKDVLSTWLKGSIG